MKNLLSVFDHLRQGRMPPIGSIPEPLLDALASFSSTRGRWTSLSSIERVLTAFRHKQPDRVPATPILGAGARQIKGISFPEFATDAEKAAEVYASGFEFVGGDLLVLLWDLSVEAADFGQKVVYPENSTAVPAYDDPAVRDVDDYRKVKPIDFSKAKRMQEFVKLCRIMVRRLGMRTVVGGFIFGPLGVLSMMRGAERLFRDCVLYPKEVRKACEAINHTLLEFAQAQCETGVSAVAIDTLYASRNGLSKQLWEEIEGPFAREISQTIKKNGLSVAIHNCGHDLYFDAQIRSMEPDAISFAHLPDDCDTPKELKERYGDQVTLIGYVPTPLLVEGTPQRVMTACREQIDVLARDGGYILAPGCEYPPNIPLTNAFSVMRAAEKYG
jgi:uroporphyrinogen decarboxylase